MKPRRSHQVRGAQNADHLKHVVILRAEDGRTAELLGYAVAGPGIQLLGRNQPLDPDFSQLRGDDGFRKLIMKMCEGTNDANCVYGGQRDNRER